MSHGGTPHPKKAEILRLRAQGLGKGEIARTLGISKGVVSGITYRLEHPEARPLRVDDSWDHKLFEPWSERKARLAKQRRTA